MQDLFYLFVASAATDIQQRNNAEVKQFWKFGNVSRKLMSKECVLGVGTGVERSDRGRGLILVCSFFFIETSP